VETHTRKSAKGTHNGRNELRQLAFGLKIPSTTHGVQQHADSTIY